MFYINIHYIKEFIRILLYYGYFSMCSRLILINCKIILLFKFLILINYYNYNKNFLLQHFIDNKKLLLVDSKINYKILNIKLTAKTTKNIIIRKFCIISIIGNNTNWIGIGIAKHKKLALAVRNSYKNAFKNIIYFYTKFLNFKYFNLKFKKTKFIIYDHTLTPILINLYNIFNLLGFFIKSKTVGVSSNISNFLYIIKKLSNVSVSKI